MNLAAIILAAGYSRRMGDFKPLMQLGGQSLLLRCADIFRRAGVENIAVITGHRHLEVEALASKSALPCIYNPHYSQGMYTSVCTAVSHLIPQGHKFRTSRQAAQLSFTTVDGFFILPVDTPLVRPATISTLTTAFKDRTAIIPVFNELPGHPPLLPATLIPAILRHDGAGGLQSLLKKVAIREIPVWDQGILLDADTPQEFAILERRVERMTIGDPSEALALAALSMSEKGVAHGLAVARTAKRLAQELERHGYKLDLELVNNAALLHDIAKGQPQHEARGAELLHRLGLSQAAEIVAVHRDMPPPVFGRLAEKEVVCLADKLLRGTVRLSVQQRFAEKLELYAGDQEACRAIRERRTNALALQSLFERTTGQKIEEILRATPNQ